MSNDPIALVGGWSLRRRIHDRRLDLFGSVTGTLTVTPELLWVEEGVLHWDGRDVPVSRTYAFARAPDGWWLCFEEGRPFHPWTPGAWVDHPCGADDYRGVVCVDGGRLRVRWDVTGPGKDLRIVTRCVRQPSRTSSSSDSPSSPTVIGMPQS